VRNVIWRYWPGLLLAAIFVALVAPLPVPARADGGAPNLAYVSGSASGVSVIDVGQGKVTKTIALAGNPAMILLSPDGRLLYVAQPALGQVAVIAAKTGQMVCAAHLPGHPTALAFSLDASVLYAGGDGAVAINPTTCQIERTYQTAGPVYGLWVTAISAIGSSSQLWTTGPDAVSIFDTRGPLLKTIPVAGGPQFLCIPSGVTAFVTTRQSSVDAIDIQSWTVRQVLAGGIYGHMDYDALTLEVYVPDARHNVIDVLAPPAAGTTALPPEPERVLRTVAPPTAIAVTNDGLFGFAALTGGKVSMFDLIDRDPVYTLTVGGTPQFVITGLYPPSSLSLLPTQPSTTASSLSATVPWWDMLIAIAALLALVCFVVLLIVTLRRGASSVKERQDQGQRQAR
jgi:DNA-binding beta-propeller fold protein YncE